TASGNLGPPAQLGAGRPSYPQYMRFTARKEGKMQTIVENQKTPPSSPLRVPARRLVALLTVGFLSAGMFAFAQEKDGSAVVSCQDDVSKIDTEVGYDWQNWSIITSNFDGLMHYVPGTTELTPRLAELYAVSDDGLT